jgi:NADPH:quinone reductase
VTNYFNRSGEAIKQLAQWIKEGKMQFKETTLEGFDKLPEAFFGLFTGKNEGKMLVKV